MRDDEDSLEMSPPPARVGKVAEYLIAASSILVASGELHVSTSLVNEREISSSTGAGAKRLWRCR